MKIQFIASVHENKFYFLIIVENVHFKAEKSRDEKWDFDFV